jgi:DNA polymerase elongation subunit (family B)
MKIAEIEFDRSGPYIVTFTRDKNNKLQTERHRFKHYYYVEDDDGPYKTLLGENCRKRYIEKFWEAKTVQKHDERKHFEGDVSYIKRFMIDHFHKIESEGKPRIMFYDIETTGFDPNEEKIVSIVAYDSYNEQYESFLADDSESSMLKKFIKYIQKIDPDILCGYNSDNFDLPFIMKRLELLGIPNNRLSRTKKEVREYYTNTGKEIRIPGRICADYFKLYKKAILKELQSYSLDFVAKEELNYGKQNITELPGTLFKNGYYDKLLQYNKRDVEILVQLDKKLHIIEFFDALADFSSVSFEDTLFNSRIVDSYILKYTSRKGIILPSRNFGNKRESDYTGGYVSTPKKGLHHDISVWDFSSLYPSIVITYNLSPETYADDWNTKPKGLLPTIFDDLFVLRKKYKNEGRDMEQKLVKAVMNSIYGVLATSSYRLYDVRIASEITRRGRELIKYVNKYALEYGAEPVYNDTDSSFIKGISSGEITVFQEYINNKITEKALKDGTNDNRLNLEFEDMFKSIFLVSKKRYIGKRDDGTYKNRGFQFLRSDTQELAKDMQEKILHDILEGASKKKIRDFYYEMKSDALKGLYNKELGIPRKFTKDLDEYDENYAVRGALNANKFLNRNYGNGDKVVVYHIKYTNNHSFNIQSLALDYDEEIPEGIVIDKKKLWERVEKAIRPLLDDMGILEETKQTTLFG